MRNICLALILGLCLVGDVAWADSGPFPPENNVDIAGDNLLMRNGSFPAQGNCLANGMPQAPGAHDAIDPTLSLWSCPGVSETPLSFRFDHGEQESCLYIDNLTDAKAFFVPLRSFKEWSHFKNATQPGPDGTLDGKVQITYGCPAETALDLCGGTAALPIARHGAQHAITTHEKRVIFACAATAGCGSWIVTDTQGECPVDGVCGSANGATLESAPTSDFCTAGTFTSVSGNGPWAWGCAGIGGGTTASCLASAASPCGSDNSCPPPPPPPPPPPSTCDNVDVLTLPSDIQWTQVDINGGDKESDGALVTGGAIASGLNRYRVGTIGDNYWGGDCQVYSRTIRFNVSDTAAVHTFKMVWSGWDDWMQIKLNGHEIANVPYLHDGLDGVFDCELSTSWGVNINPDHHGYQYPVGGNPSNWDVYGSGQLWLGGSDSGMGYVTYDLEPYLVTGTNTIEMSVIVYGGGEGWFDLIIDAGSICVSPTLH